MKNLIVAREKEQAELERLVKEPTAQLLAVYGRRRTG
jgi:AAA+ ATPase superfamily predicted ATPase